MKGFAIAGVLVVALIAPALAHADVETFVVDTTSDLLSTNACTTTPNDCSLRGAFSRAQDSDPATDRDTIEFLPGTFDGFEAVPGDATIALESPLVTDEDLTLRATCSTTQPCVNIDAVFNNNGINVLGGDFAMSGVSIYGAGFPGTPGFAGLFLGGGGGATLDLENNWFGLKIDGTVVGNGTGIVMTGGSSVVGGIGTEPNVFGGNGTGITVFGGNSDRRILGNYFGVKDDGVTPADNELADIEIVGNLGNEGPQTTTIGSTDGAATPQCDLGCNVIASRGSWGIKMVATAGSNTSTARGVNITGNHIGLNAAGTGAIGTGELVGIGQADEVSVYQNKLAGGDFGVTGFPDSESTVVQANTFGLDANGNQITGTDNLEISVWSDVLNPALVSENEILPGDAGATISVFGSGALLENNTVGIEGESESGGSIEVSGSDHVIGGSENSIANRIYGARSSIVLIGDGSDRNRILVNKGKGSGPFIDLAGADGPGNGSDGPNEGIQAPKIKKSKKEKAEGTGAPGAKIWLYKSESGDGKDPKGLVKLLDKVTVKGSGDWKISGLKKNDVVTALQIDENGNSSELSKGKKVKK